MKQMIIKLSAVHTREYKNYDIMFELKAFFEYVCVCLFEARMNCHNK